MPRPNAAHRSQAVAAILLSALVAAVYGKVGALGFVFDDGYFFDHNPHVRHGLTLAGLRWALTATVGGTWHPLTLASLMLDVELFGASAAAHHLVNALLHLANTLLLFGLVRRLTGLTWRSAAVAALFAAHPLHVESVAWIAERKDVLSTCFGLLALHCWARHAARPGAARYLATLLCLVLSLAAKPMLVTLPLLMLLLDAWPLGRWAGWRTLGEKAPLAGVAAAAAAVAYSAQLSEGAMSLAGRHPIPVRAANAAASFLAYLGSTLWPSRLSVMYPHPGAGLPAWKWIAGAGLVAALTALALQGRRRRPWLATGWLWFVCALLPVIGLVQVGEQAYADRYTYVALIGLFLAAAWALPPACAAVGARRLPVAAAVGATLACAVLSSRQLDHWRDNLSLYRHAVETAPGSWMMHANLAAELLASGEVDAAVAHLREAVRLQPGLAEGHHNLALGLERQGRLEEAAREYRETLRLNPVHPAAHANLGSALSRLGRPREAVPHLDLAARQRPRDAGAWACLGFALCDGGRPAEALAAFETARRIDPRRADLRNGTAAALESLGRLAAAAAELREAVRLDPGNAFYAVRLATLLARADLPPAP